MDGVPRFRGVCSCGWESQSFSESEARALKTAKAHGEAKQTAILKEAASDTAHDPARVIEAIRRLVARHDVKAVLWESGRVGVAVYCGDNGTAAIRYYLTADLSEITHTDRIGRFS